MEPIPTPPRPPQKKGLTFWPALINMGLLLSVSGVSGGNTRLVVSTVAGLAALSGLLALYAAFSRRHRSWIIPLLLALLVVLLIGIGVCALILSHMG